MRKTKSVHQHKNRQYMRHFIKTPTQVQPAAYISLQDGKPVENASQKHITNIVSKFPDENNRIQNQLLI